MENIRFIMGVKMFKYYAFKTSLKKVEYNFNLPESGGMIDIAVVDRISNIEIKVDEVEFNASRQLNFANLNGSALFVEFKVSVKVNGAINKDDFISDFKADSNRNIFGTAIFSRISQVIANITGCSAIGPIITTANFDVNNIEIE